MRSELAWRGRELFASDGWRQELSASERVALDVFVRQTSDRLPETINRSIACFPNLSVLAKQVSHSLEHGTGAVMLSQFVSSAWDTRAAARAFWTFALQLGTPVSQSATGQRLFDVRDEGFAPTDPRFRGPMSSKRLSFHTDRCDVIAFLCLRPASNGGKTYVVSSVAVHDELRRRHPEVLAVLNQPFPYLRHTVDRGNARQYVELPIFSECDGFFAAHFLRVLIDRADRSAVAPELTGPQRVALDTLEAVAKDSALHVSFNMASGDVLLLNNWTTFHRRGEFTDSRNAEERRHLLRIWLAMRNSRPLAPCFKEHFGSTVAGAVRGGMRPVVTA